jgi:hypothetical protein
MPIIINHRVFIVNKFAPKKINEERVVPGKLFPSPLNASENSNPPLEISR